MEWLSSSEQWPRHPDKNWRLLLTVAKENGWYLKKLTSHAFARIVCLKDDFDGRCEIKIYSSGKSSESFARNSIRKIKRCEHR